jgi:polyphenol oxidase
MSRSRAALAEPREVIRSPALAGVAHGFLTASGPPGEPDPGQIVPGGELVLLRQVHSPIALAVDSPFAAGERPEADALASATPGLVLGIVTADCAPVLLADRRAGVVGAAHAGWRGAHAGVLEAVVEIMEALGAHREDMAAAIGPTIALESYEVDDAFRTRFTLSDGRFFAPGREGHWFFDLEGYVEARLDTIGVWKVERLGLDTYTNEDRFHSYRRAVHRGAPTYGRQYSLIGLPA